MANTITTYGAILIVVAIYYAIAAAVVYYFGTKWFVPAWSFPIVLFALFALTPSNRLVYEGLFVYVLSLAVLFAVLAVVLWAMSTHPSYGRGVFLLLGIVTWFGISFASLLVRTPSS